MSFRKYYKTVKHCKLDELFEEGSILILSCRPVQRHIINKTFLIIKKTNCFCQNDVLELKYFV